MRTWLRLSYLLGRGLARTGIAPSTITGAGLVLSLAVPAAVLGFTDRGLLLPGLAADIVIFDPETVGPDVKAIGEDRIPGQRRWASRPKGFAATWEFGGQVSWIEVTLEPVADGTRFTLEHVAHVPDEFWTQYGPGATGVGWDLALLGLATHLATGESASAEAQEWATSPDGIAFATASSAAWEAVSVEAGTDPEAARAAGARTTAFYTGAPEEG